MIPIPTDYEIVGVNVYEIVGKPEGSQIQADKALFVVDIPDSERAPHQSKRNFRYYVRLGARSQPASHRLVEDIRSRVRHPSLALSLLELTQVQIPRESLPRVAGHTMLRFVVTVGNPSSLMSGNSCLYFSFPDPDLAWANYDNRVVKPRRAKENSAMFWEALDPIYPGMEFTFWFELQVRIELVSTHPQFRNFWRVSGRDDPDAIEIKWRVFADNARPIEGRTTLGELGLLGMLRRAITADAAYDDISKQYGGRIA